MTDAKSKSPPEGVIDPNAGSAASQGPVRLMACSEQQATAAQAFVQKVNATVATPAGTWERFTPRVMNQSTALHLLFPPAQDKPVGYAALEGRYLAFFALLPPFRRRGLGRSVIESLLIKHGGTLSMHVRASNSAACRFYDNLASPEIIVEASADGTYEDGGERIKYVLTLRASKRLS